jgi:hypothetical protein
MLRLGNRPTEPLVRALQSQIPRIGVEMQMQLHREIARELRLPGVCASSALRWIGDSPRKPPQLVSKVVLA